MRIQTVVNGEWKDQAASTVTPELQVLLRQRFRDAEIVGHDPADVTVMLMAPGHGNVREWRMVP